MKQINSIVLLEENDANLESLFSKQDDPDEDTVFAIPDDDDDESEFSYDLDSEEEPTSPKYVMCLQHKETDNMVHQPFIKIGVLLSKYDKPIQAISFMDTGAAKRIMNPDVLPLKEWKPHSEWFQTASIEPFHTTLITKKKIGLKFFLDCIFWTKVIGSSLPNRDVLIGMDVLS